MKILGVCLLAGGLGTSTTARAQCQHGSTSQQPVQQEHERAPKGKSTSLQGELVDMGCFMAMNGRGEEHQSCALACIGGGAPMGILTADEDLVLLLEDHDAKEPYEALKEKAAEQVKVSGTFFKRGGVPALLVKSVAGVE
jgi:hypothetical protein